ncbi:MAG: peptide ABC transporter substrate-binding protein [Nibricoccus sp.]
MSPIRRSFTLSDFIRRAATVAVAACLLFTGCGRRETRVERGNREQTLHRSISPDIAQLDPQLSTVANDYAAIHALFEGLVSEDPVGLHPVPAIAQSWDITPDGLRYVFHLRDNAKWSNGDRVTAHDFVASYKRILSPSFTAYYAYLFYVIDQAEPFHKGKLADFSQVGISALDDYTLQIKLEHADPSFLSLLSLAPFLPVHVPTIEKHGGLIDRANPWTKPAKIVTNGPFVLKEWRLGQVMILTKSPNYWDAAAVRLNQIRLYATESRDAEERDFRGGLLHLTEALPPGKADAWRDDPQHRLRLDPLLGTEFYRINVTRPFLNDRRVRRALALAVDRDAIVNKILRAGQLPAHAFTPPKTAGYTPEAQIPTDFEAARALLVEAGYPGGKGAPAIELLFNTSESHRAVAEAIQEMWRRELGLEIRLTNQENSSMRATRNTGSYQIMRSVWIGDYVDPQTFLSMWTSDSGNNYTGWKNTHFDQILFEAARTSDAATRNALYQKAEALLLEDAPLIPIYYYTHTFLIQPSVKGWYPNLLDHHPYKHVYLENN